MLSTPSRAKAPFALTKPFSYPAAPSVKISNITISSPIEQFDGRVEVAQLQNIARLVFPQPSNPSKKSVATIDGMKVTTLSPSTPITVSGDASIRIFDSTQNSTEPAITYTSSFIFFFLPHFFFFQRIII